MSESSLHSDQAKSSQVEVGLPEVLHTHAYRYVLKPPPVLQKKLDFEASRPRWLRECLGEMTGVFIYVYPGIAAIAASILGGGDPAKGSMLSVAFAFTMGIALAIIMVGPVSGSHLNPAITISLALFGGFPWKKVPHYILSQVAGSFLAGLVLMGQYWEQIQAYKSLLISEGITEFNTAHGPGGILCAFPADNQNNLGYLFLIEFFVDFFIGLVIWTCLDPANPFVSHKSIPFVIGFGYFAMIIGFGGATISTNLARDLGTRIVAAIFFGGSAFSYKSYSWIAILVNIPATLLAVVYYECALRDSVNMIAVGHATHEHGKEGLVKHLTKTGDWELAEKSKIVTQTVAVEAKA